MDDDRHRMQPSDMAMPRECRDDIVLLARFVQNLVDRQVEQLLPARSGEFQTLFESIGDMAYGRFNTLLFGPVRRALEAAGLKAVPRLPGSFQSSREWGNSDETHQQRWMISRIVRINDGSALGSLAVGSHHDHHRFRLPRSPEIIALIATSPGAVVAEMSMHRPQFAQTEAFRDWYARYRAHHSH